MTILIDCNAGRRQALGKTYTFFERLVNLFVIQGVRGAVDQTLAIGDSRAAPRLQQFNDARFTLFRHGAHALGTYRARMREKFIGNDALFFVPCESRSHFTMLARHGFVTLEKFLDLQRVIRQRLGRRINCRQATADYHHRQPQLHVGDGIGFSCARELQRHQKVRRGAHAARKTIGHIEHRRPSRAQRQRHVVKAHRERFVCGNRAAESHAAEKCKLAAPL